MSISHLEAQKRRAMADATAVEGLSIGEYLIRRLQDYGIRDVFGIPGDYILSFYHMLDNSPINVIGCTREDCAGFAADAYARVNGMGAVCVTYTVGGLSLCNSIAGAYAEKSPVVVISGAPGQLIDAAIPRGVMSATLQRFVRGIKRLSLDPAKSA